VAELLRESRPTVSRRTFTTAGTVVTLLAPLYGARASDEGKVGSTAVDLAVAYYEAYNAANWPKVYELLNAYFRFTSNSGYLVETTHSTQSRLGAGYEKTTGGPLEAKEAIDFLRDRRKANNATFYIDEDRSQFFSPQPNVAIAWVSRPGARGSFGLPIPEVHIFRCDIRSVGPAVTEAKIVTLDEVNLDNYETA
jgi:hypothetical protein